jgi:hypothetical protein
MKKLLFVVILFIASEAFTQHCPYDFAGIIVLNIHAKNDTVIIPGLLITIHDKEGDLMMTTKYVHNKWEAKVDAFWQNPSNTTFKGYIDNNNPAENEKIRFPFAKNNYVLVVSSSLIIDTYTVEIIDPSGKYLPKEVRLSRDNLYSLCGTYQDAEYVTSNSNPTLYQPLEIILK